MRTIRSLEDLKAAKRELAVRKRATRKAFGTHIGDFRDDANKYLLKKLLLPLGAAVAGGLVWKYLISAQGASGETTNESSKQSFADQQPQANAQSTSGVNWIGYARILLSLFKIYQNMTAPRREESIEGEPEDAVEQVLSPRDFVNKFRESQAES